MGKERLNHLTTVKERLAYNYKERTTMIMAWLRVAVYAGNTLAHKPYGEKDL